MAESPKTILITGAGSGIGRSVAERFAAEGWRVALTDIDAPALASVQAMLPANCARAFSLDVTDLGQWRAVMAEVSAWTGGRLDVLLNNAGIGADGWFEDVAPEVSAAIVDVNLKGVIHGALAGLPLLSATPQARLLNVASASGLFGVPKAAVYSASKAAVITLSSALDLEFRRRGVRVAAIVPWVIQTPFLARGPDPAISARLAKTKAYPVSDAVEVIWRAAHDDRSLWWVGREARRAWRLSRWAPGLVRRALARMLVSPAAT